jgi:uridine kinase
VSANLCSASDVVDAIGALSRVRTNGPTNGPTDPLTKRTTTGRTATGQTDRPFILVGIGGRGAAGKTTIARKLASECDAQIVATDSFWTGEHFDLDRLRTEVVDVLVDGGTPHFVSFDWATKTSVGARSIHPSGVIVIEGVCALHQMFREFYDIRVWVEAPREIRLHRATARDGEQARHQWETVWMPNEEAYIERDRPIGIADLIVDGTATLN